MMRGPVDVEVYLCGDTSDEDTEPQFFEGATDIELGAGHLRFRHRGEGGEVHVHTWLGMFAAHLDEVEQLTALNESKLN
jgi:hypothetical protein